jgi:hypothetical protein
LPHWNALGLLDFRVASFIEGSTHLSHHSRVLLGNDALLFCDLPHEAFLPAHVPARPTREGHKHRSQVNFSGVALQRLDYLSWR